MAQEIEHTSTHPEPHASITLQVSRPSDVHVVQQKAREIALAIGFEEGACEEIVIAVSELASNLAKHAKEGKLTLSPIGELDQIGIQIESHDAGPGIDDVERAITDGVSTAGSLGYGLGTVNRLMDVFDITSRRGEGTHIVCRRWHRTMKSSTLPAPLDFGAATRTHPGMEVNGDSFVIKRWSDHVLIGLIDGLGHGQFAHRAAETARQYVESHYDQPLEAIFCGTSRACRATRGVVMALARFDWQSETGNPANQPRPIRLSFASIGNVEIRVRGNSAPLNLMPRRGIIGGNAPHAVVTTHAWDAHAVMALFTDGISTHWRWDDFPSLSEESASVVAQRLLRRLAKDADDATVVIVKRGR